MADKTYYAWSPIRTANDKGDVKVIPVGAKVTKGEVGDDFDMLVSEGVLRTREYPKVTGDETPKQAVLRQARELLRSVEEGNYGTDEAKDARAALTDTRMPNPNESKPSSGAN